MGSVVDSYCKGCQYLGSNSYGKWCRYNDVTGHVRGCPAGKDCIRYLKGPAKHTPNASPFASAYSKKQASSEIKPKKEKKPPMTPEERYEHDKARKRQRARELQEKAQGRQRAAIAAYKEATGDSNYQISLKIGVHESTVNKWANEYVPADWSKLAILGIQKPEGL